MSIELYSWNTPNGWKVSILLEELELPYKVTPINISADEQFNPEFLKISPNNKIPAIIDPDGPDGQPIALFDSVMILQYLAEKTGRYFPTDTRQRWAVQQWLAFQMAHVGPMLGQAHHFRSYAPDKIDYAIKRYTDEATRLYSVLDRRLAESAFIATDELTIADFAVFPWIMPHKGQGQDLADYPHLQKWFQQIKERPTVKRGMSLLRDGEVTEGKLDHANRERLFGKQAG